MPYLRSSAFICGFLLLMAQCCADEPQFTISYWCGPPAKFNTLDRYQEIKDANFTLAFPSCSGMNVEQNRQMLDHCQQVGLKGMIQDARMPYALDEKGKAA